MTALLKLGFQNCVCLRSFAVIPRNSKVGASVFLTATTTGSKGHLCHWSPSAKLRESMNIEHKSGTAVGKESVVQARKVETEIIGDDADTIDRMTVQELRSKLRSVGVPAKGCKSDLVSTLRDFLTSSVDGQGSLVVDQQSSELKTVCAKNNSSKRKTKSSSGEEHAQELSTVLEVSELQCTKRRVKQVQVKDSNVEVKTTLLTTMDKRSVKIDEVSGKKPCRSKSKGITEVDIGVVATSGETNISVNQIEPWAIFAHKKPQKGWIAYNPRTMRLPPLSGDSKFVKLMSWNVNGLRALLKLESFSALQLAQREDFDVLCLQETKLQEKDVEAIKQSLQEGYENSFWTCSGSKLGYSGTAIISRELEKSKPVILTGDLNCAHEEIDIYNPDGNRRSAGFTVEERQSFAANFLSKGFVDTFRELHPGVVGYTYWGYRHGGRKTNKGWRLDYFLASKSISGQVHDSYILPDVTGSDHCPIGLVLKI